VSTTNRYIIGPTAELHLPFGLGVELDALYRHVNYSGSTTLAGAITGLTSAEAGNWEFPLLAKYRFPFKVVRPYVDAGVAWNTISGLSQTIVTTTGISKSSSSSDLNNGTVTGFVTGVGVDIHLLVLHVMPEIRYTRWGAQNFLSPNGGLSSNQNQAEFLLGVTF
jgi:opacity protein-like surface antigen